MLGGHSRRGWAGFFTHTVVYISLHLIVTAADRGASSEDEFKPDSEKSGEEEEEEDDDELSVVESTSGSSPEESEIETPEKVLNLLYFIIHSIGIGSCFLCTFCSEFAF